MASSHRTEALGYEAMQDLNWSREEKGNRSESLRPCAPTRAGSGNDRGQKAG
jgi:hypothetical protein